MNGETMGSAGQNDAAPISRPRVTFAEHAHHRSRDSSGDHGKDEVGLGAASTLTADMLCEIFVHLSYEDRVSTSHVSRHWRKASYSDPSRLWSYIPPLAAADRLGELLSRAGSAPVDITRIDVRASTIGALSKLLASNMHRVRSLSLQLRGIVSGVDENRWERCYNGLRTALRRPAPILESFDLVDIEWCFALDTATRQWNLFAGQAPRLRKLVLHGDWTDLRPLQSLHNIDKLHLAPETRPRRPLNEDEGPPFIPFGPTLASLSQFWPRLSCLRIDAPARAIFHTAPPRLHLPHLDDLTLQSASAQAGVLTLLAAFNHDVVRRLSLWPYAGHSDRQHQNLRVLVDIAQNITPPSVQPLHPAIHVDVEVILFGATRVRIVDGAARERLYHLPNPSSIFAHLQQCAFHRVESATIAGLEEVRRSAGLASLHKVPLSQARLVTLLADARYEIDKWCRERAHDAPVVRAPMLETLVVVHNRVPPDEDASGDEGGSASEDEEDENGGDDGRDDDVAHQSPATTLAQWLVRKVNPVSASQTYVRIARLELRGVWLGPEHTRDLSPLDAVADVVEVIPWEEVDDAQCEFPFDGSTPGWSSAADALWM